MMTRVLIVGLLLAGTLAYARKRDPLTDAESDQLREMRLEPAKRLKLYTKFAAVRLDRIDESLHDPKQSAERPAKIHDLLEDFSAIIDEINDNLDTFEGDPRLDQTSRKDYRKGLKELIVEEGRLRARVRTLEHDVQANPAMAGEAKDYLFVLGEADEALKSGLETAREYSAKKDEEKPTKK